MSEERTAVWGVHRAGKWPLGVVSVVRLWCCNPPISGGIWSTRSPGWRHQDWCLQWPVKNFRALTYLCIYMLLFCTYTNVSIFVVLSTNMALLWSYGFNNDFPLSTRLSIPSSYESSVSPSTFCIRGIGSVTNCFRSFYAYLFQLFRFVPFLPAGIHTMEEKALIYITCPVAQLWSWLRRD